MEYLIYSVEDDKDISRIINLTLTRAGYQVASFENGKSLFEGISKKVPNMILLDMMLPGMTGQEILKKIRANSIFDDIEIIIISANRELLNKIDGLELGADDYIEKPFDILELMSRINSKVRRFKKSKIIEVKDIKIDINNNQCFKSGQEIKLTPREFDILAILMSKAGQVVKKEEILNKIWGTDVSLETRTVDMHIMALRQKLEDKKANFIVTLYGLGFKINL
jgi:two-component system alkaline phosphatase synthesis response regulator PhoP